MREGREIIIIKRKQTCERKDKLHSNRPGELTCGILSVHEPSALTVVLSIIMRIRVRELFRSDHVHNEVGVDGREKLRVQRVLLVAVARDLALVRLGHPRILVRHVVCGGRKTAGRKGR